VIGDNCSIWPLVAIRGDMNHIRIGSDTNVQDGSILHITHAGPFNPAGYPLEIGDQVTIGHHAMLHGCTIGNRVLIGMAATVMDGAVVEDDVVVGAGSLVPPGQRLESGKLYMGRPAKAVRELTDDEKAYFAYSAQNYVDLKDEHLKEDWAVL
jgi:carbonic anhydrase/acetyltransferase-like protein (isoleucine patch superfamily)